MPTTMPSGLQRGRGKVKDVTNQRFGRLTALEYVGRKDRKTWWRCRCDCGQILFVVQNNLQQGRALSCGCSRYACGVSHKRWRGHGEIGGSFWQHVQEAAATRKIPFGLTIQQGWDLFLRQQRRCALSGLPLTFPAASTVRGTASLDRIDSSLGYVPGNVQWVHKDLNLMKNTLDERRFVELCTLVADHRRSHVRKAR